MLLKSQIPIIHFEETPKGAWNQMEKDLPGGVMIGLWSATSQKLLPTFPPLVNRRSEGRTVIITRNKPIRDEQSGAHTEGQAGSRHKTIRTKWKRCVCGQTPNMVALLAASFSGIRHTAARPTVHAHTSICMCVPG